MKAYILTLAIGLYSLPLIAQKHISHQNRFYKVGEISENFENRISNSWRLSINDERQLQKDYSVMQYINQPESQIRFSQKYARQGSTSLQMTVPHELGKFRSEIALYPVAMGSEYWYAFSIYLPQDWQYDSQDNILAQWHADKNTKNHIPGDGTGLPPISIAVTGDRWNVKIHYNPSGPSFDGPDKGSQTYDGGKIATARWTDFVAHAKWSPSNNGLLEIWKDGEKIVDYKGPVSYQNDLAPYFKIGIYHPSWRAFRKDAFDSDKSATRPITVYYDAVSVSQNPIQTNKNAP